MLASRSEQVDSTLGRTIIIIIIIIIIIYREELLSV